MIQAVFERAEDGGGALNHRSRREVVGHGFDVVCASRSTLAINFVNSVVGEIRRLQTNLELNEIEGGCLKVRVLRIYHHTKNDSAFFESFSKCKHRRNSSEFAKPSYH